MERKGGWDTEWQVDLNAIDINDVSHKVDIQHDDDYLKSDTEGRQSFCGSNED